MSASPLKDDEEDAQERDVFEIQDFTCTGRWERFVASMEGRLRKWKLHDEDVEEKSDDISGKVSYTLPSPRGTGFNHKQYVLSYHRCKSHVKKSSNSSKSSPPSTFPRARWVGDNVMSQILLSRHYFSESSTSIPRAFGVRRFLTLTTKDSKIHASNSTMYHRHQEQTETLQSNIDEAEARALLSSLSLACDSCKCILPCFTEIGGVGHPRMWVGQLVCRYPIRYHMEILQRSEVPRNLRTLSGLSRHLSSRRALERDALQRQLVLRGCNLKNYSSSLQNLETRVSVLVTFERSRFSLTNLTSYSSEESTIAPYSWRHVLPSHDRIFGASWGPQECPISRLRLHVAWPTIPESQFLSNGSSKDSLNLGRAPKWELKSIWRKEPNSAYGASSTLRNLLEAYLHAMNRESFHELKMEMKRPTVKASSLSGVWHIRPVNYEVQLDIRNGVVTGKNLSSWMGRIEGHLDGSQLTFKQIALTNDGKERGYVAECTATFDGIKIFDGKWKDSNQQSGVFWCVKKDLSLQSEKFLPFQVKRDKNQLNEASSRHDDSNSLPDFQTRASLRRGPAPFQSVLSKISRHLEPMAEISGPNSQNAIIQELVRVWYETLTSLRKHWEEKTDIKDLYSEPSPSLHFCVIHQKLQALQCCISASKNTDEVIGSPTQKERKIMFPGREGCESSDSEEDVTHKALETEVKSKFTKTVEKMKSELTEPTFRKTCPLTTDEGHSLVVLVSRFLADLPTASAIVSRQWRGIAGAIQSFKHANAGSNFSLFQSWRARKLEELNRTDDPNLRFLSPGGATIPEKVVEHLWKSLSPSPAVLQMPSFDPALLAEQILDYLWTIPPSVLLPQLAACAVSNAIVCLRMSVGSQARIGSIAHALDNLSALSPSQDSKIDSKDENLKEKARSSSSSTYRLQFPGLYEFLIPSEEELSSQKFIMNPLKMRKFCRTFEEVERKVARGTAVVHALAPTAMTAATLSPKMLEELLELGKVQIEMKDRDAVAQCFLPKRHRTKSFPQTHVSAKTNQFLQAHIFEKEYVFRTVPKSLWKGEFKSGFGSTTEELLRGGKREFIVERQNSVLFATVSNIRVTHA